MAEIQKYTIEKAAKESLRALAMGWQVEKKMLKPASKGVKELLRYYAALELPKVHGRLERTVSKAGVIFSA